MLESEGQSDAVLGRSGDGVSPSKQWESMFADAIIFLEEVT